MYEEYYETYPVYSNKLNNNSVSNNYGYVDDRGFLVPFVLGGITGGLLAPAFYRPYPYYNQYPYYGPYYR